MDKPSATDQFFIPFRRLPELMIGLALLTCLLLTYWIYSPGLSGPLVLDDLWNLSPLGDNGGVDSLGKLRQFLFSNTSGPTGRPVAMASFLLDAQDWPAVVASFKYTNILLHLLTGTMLFWFSLLLAELTGLSRQHAMQVALVVTALWLLHPFNNSTVLYVVQRMTQLMALFALAALVCYLIARKLLTHRPTTAAVLLGLSLFPFGVLSVLSKENGALLLLQIIIIELLFFRHLAVTRFFKYWLRLGVVLPLLLALLYLLINLPDTLAGYDVRQFTLTERLLTETRVLLVYLGKILVPSISGNGVFHDDIIISTSLFSPLTTILSCALILALLFAAFTLRQRQPVLSLAVFWFFSLHILESSFIPLELYFEHRNYLPMIGPLFAIAYYFRRFLSEQEGLFALNWAKFSMLSLVAAVLTLSASLTLVSANTWGNALQLHALWAESKPQSIRAQIAYAAYLNAIGQPGLAMQTLQIAQRSFPNAATLQLSIWNQACEYDLPSSVSLEAIASNPQLEHFRDDINHPLGVLLENYFSQRCAYPDQDILISLFDRIEQLPLSTPRKASFYVLYSDLFVYFGMLDPTLINLTRSYELNRVPQLPIRQALHAASAGDLNAALVFLERAKLADAEDNPLLPSSMDEILSLERYFKAGLNAGQ